MSIRSERALAQEDPAAGGPQQESDRGPVRGPVLVTWLLAFCFYLAAAWNPAWSNDESATVVVVRQSFSQVWRYAGLDPALGPYYLIMKPWSLISTDHLWLRLPSVIAMSTAVALLFVLVCRMIDQRTACFSALLMAALPMVARFGQDARPYALALLATVGAMFMWWLLRSTGQRRFAVGLSALLLVGALLHAYSLVILLPMVVATLATPGAHRRRETGGLAVAAGATLALISPYLLYSVGHATGSPNPLPMSVASIAKLWLKVGIFDARPALALVFAVSVLAMAVAGGVLAWRGTAGRRDVALLYCGWVVFPPTLMIVLQLITGKPGLVYRYWIFILPGLAVLAAIFLRWLTARKFAAGVVLAIVVVVLAVPAQLALRGTDGHFGQVYLALASTLETGPFQNEPLLATGATYRSVLANSPGSADRFPLIVAAPGKLVNEVFPKQQPVGSAAVRSLQLRDSVLVFKAMTIWLTKIPTGAAFQGSAAVRGALSQPLVLCNSFGHALGVFGKSATQVSEAAKKAMASALESQAPGHIHCATQ
ncbi:MAG: glycosyltransferase family 39 protein [Actinomycetes bacterium]